MHTFEILILVYAYKLEEWDGQFRKSRFNSGLNQSKLLTFLKMGGDLFYVTYINLDILVLSVPRYSRVHIDQ